MALATELVRVDDDRAELELDGVKYVFNMANAMASYGAFKKACAVLKNADKDSSLLGVLLGSIGDPAVAPAEKLVLDNVVVHVDGETFKLSTRIDQHFNKYRKHLFPVLTNGAKFQYGDFFDLSVLGQLG